MNTFYFSPLYFSISFAIIIVFFIINRKYEWITKDDFMDMNWTDRVGFGLLSTAFIVTFFAAWPFLVIFFLISAIVYLIFRYIILNLLP